MQAEYGRTEAASAASIAFAIRQAGWKIALVFIRIAPRISLASLQSTKFRLNASVLTGAQTHYLRELLAERPYP